MSIDRLDCLASLSPVEFAQRRKDLAQELEVTLKALDAEYKERKRAKADDEALQSHWKVEPWLDEVDGKDLLSEIEDKLKKHVVMDEHSRLVCALWCVLAWLHEAAVHSPILLVSSPEAECGKTTLLSLICFITPRGMIFVEGSSSVIYRMIDKWHPTLIVDEADKIFRNNPELRAVINSGWTRGAGVPRCHPETHEPEFFETFGPKAIGMKGLTVPDTTLSRSIKIAMQRKLPDDEATDFEHTDDDELAELRRKLARFAVDNLDRTAELRRSIAMPGGFNNRLAANWRLVLAIADLCGEGERARKAARVLSRRTEEASARVQAVADILTLMEKRKVEAMHSEDVVAALVEMEDRPWAEWGYKKQPITKNQLASLLKDFEIAPKQVRIGAVNKNGYLREILERARTRYQTSTTLQPAENGQNSVEFQSFDQGPTDVFSRAGCRGL
jgi:putative DNA primase/helicase